jgi:hypothetical protein
MPALRIQRNLLGVYRGKIKVGNSSTVKAKKLIDRHGDISETLRTINSFLKYKIEYVPTVCYNKIKGRRARQLF